MEDYTDAVKQTILRNERMAVDKKRKEDAEEATIKMSKKNWIERHPFWFGLMMLIIGALLGAISTRIIEQLFPLHNQ